MMLAKGTSPIIILPPVLFFTCFLIYFLFWDDRSLVILAALFLLLFMIGTIFFRDPNRTIGKGIVSSADGKVRFVKISKGKLIISVFMNIHNVHVNRAPIKGKVRRTKHVQGGHIPAYKELSRYNEHFITDLVTALGPVRIVQIAGTVARRIVPYIEKGEGLEKGQRIGIIRLGSRVDLTFPADRVKPLVKPGQRVLAGETTIAKVKGKEKGKRSRGAK